MKGIFKKTLSMILCFVMVFTMLQGTMLSASAKVVGPDSKTELTITTDKSKYSWGDTIIFNITVKNVSNETLKGIKINSFAREVTQIAQQGDLPVIAELKPGESKTVQIEYFATKLASFLIIFMPIFWLFNPVGRIAYREANFNYEQKVKIGLFRHKVGFKVENNADSNENNIFFSAPDEKNIVTDSSTGISYVNNEILLSVKEGTNIDIVTTSVEEFGAEIVGWIDGFDEYQIRLNKTLSASGLQNIIDNLKNKDFVLDAFLDYAMKISDDDYLVPNDPWGGNQDWNSDIPDGNNWGVEAIKAPVAWAHRDEMNPITIGLIDSGFDTGHSDLTITCPQDNVAVADHGTHVAGTMAADMDRDGVTGVMPTVKSNGDRLVTLIGTSEVQNGSGFEDWFTFELKCSLAELIIRNTKIINISQGFNWYDPNNWDNTYYVNGAITDKARNVAREYSLPIESFIKKTIEKNYEFLIVGAAGNDDGIDASFSSPWNIIEDEAVKSRIVVVGSIKNGGKESHWFKADTHKGYTISSFSNLGERVDIVAPGDKIYSTVPISMDTDGNADGFANTYVKNGKTYLWSGTSMAAPHVSGVASMVWSINPNLTGKQVKEIVVKSADRPITHTDGITYNILNAENAVNEAIKSKSSITPWPPENQQYGAVISRVVESANENNFIAGATISAYTSSGEYVGSAMSDEEAGQFELFLPEGTYTIIAYQIGYMPAVLRNVQSTANEVNYSEWFKLSEASSGSRYTVKGKITNAVDNSALANVKMRFINLYEQEVETEIYTASDGSYSVTLPTACYEVAISKEGFVDSQFNVIAAADMEGINQNSMLSPSLGDGQYRIVLTWNENPHDLDSHLTGPTSSGGSFHVYYPSSSMNAYDGDTLVANLDIDDTSSYGPETITLTPTTTGTYKYYVHRYAGSGSISTSGAQVKLYKGNTLIGTYNAPTDQGTGIYWTVFEITNGTVKNINKIAGSVQ